MTSLFGTFITAYLEDLEFSLCPDGWLPIDLCLLMILGGHREGEKSFYVGLAKSFVRLVNTLFNTVLGEDEKCLFLFKTERTFWPAPYLCTFSMWKHG